MEIINNSNFVENLKNNLHLNEEIVFKNAIPNDISWQDFESQRFYGNLYRPTRWDNPYLSITFEIDGCPIMKKHKSFSIFRDSLYKIWNDKVWDEPAVIMSTITGNDSGLNFHEDICPQIHWNCIGVTEWNLKRNSGENIKYILNPGDIIYIPKGMWHTVKSLVSPRAGIAYSIRVY